MLAVIAPGQGSQKPGFLTPWLDLPGVEARLRWWSALAGVDLAQLAPGLTEVRTDRAENVALHREVVDRVARALTA